ncbi:MAG: MarR family transcriptional regulator [Clostridia bacterium]|nr:MarR family transcriptional regulator [Clostridia bacterium]
MNDKYDALKLDNQLCFPLYACAKEIVKRYTPFLEELDLTYTQYITMMAMWEHKKLLVKELGRCLYLDSGTLTPLLKKLEEKGFVTRTRPKDDERNLLVTLTEQGEALREQALGVPAKIGACIRMEPADAWTLYQLLHKLLGSLSQEES